MDKSGALLLLGLTKVSTHKEIQASIDEKQNALNIKIAYSENGSLTQAYQQKLREILEASALLLEPEEEPASAIEVRAAIVSKMSGQPDMEISETITDQPIEPSPIPSAITTEPQHENKPKLNRFGFILVTIIILLLLGITAVKNYDGFALVKSDESILQTAAVEKIRGEIGAYQRRLETVRTELVDELKIKEQSHSILNDSQYRLKKQINDILFKASLLSELEGEMRMGESLLQQQSFAQSRETFAKVKDQYVELWQRYNAAVEFISLSKKVGEIRSSYNSILAEYKLDESPEISLTDQNIKSAYSAFDTGHFDNARQDIQAVSENFQQAIQSAKEQIHLLKQQREKALFIEVEAESIRLEKIEAEKIKIVKAATLKAKKIAEEEKRLADLDKKKKADELAQQLEKEADELAQQLEKEAEENRLAQQLEKEAEEKRLALLEEKRLNLTKPPKLVKFVQPDYPRRAYFNEIDGWVEFRFTIATDGTPKDIVLVDASPPRTFNREALVAFKKWKFEPYTEDGKPVEKLDVKYRIIFNFD